MACKLKFSSDRMNNANCHVVGDRENVINLHVID